VQVGIAVPIFDGLRRQKRRDEQGARYDAQKLREYDVTQQVDAEARQVVLDLTAARDEVLVAQQRLRLADLELKQADERVSAGVAGSVETTNAQRNLVGARDALIQARVSLDIARINSYRALGIIVPANGQ
jgi:outer membrane protein